MVNYIVLDALTASEFTLPDHDRILGEFGKLNVFVGKNNAGKSRLLRKLFDKSHKITSNAEAAVRFFDNETNPLSNIDSIYRIKSKTTRSYSISGEDYQKLEQFHNLLEERISTLPTLLEFVRGLDKLTGKDPLLKYKTTLDQHGVSDILIDQQNKWLQEISSVRHAPALTSLYIPILRGLRPIQSVGDGKFNNADSFHSRTRLDYKLAANRTIFTGLSMYEDITKLLLGTEEDRKLIADFETFLSEQVFSEKVTLIPKHDGDVLHIKIGDKPQLEIYNLGDGLQTIITILFPVFIGKESERLVFIEEPEAHLHPLWQVKLLNALKQIPNQQYFITTHSNAFINDGEARLFSVRQTDKTMRITEAKLENEKLAIIRELGYKQSDLLQANYILWVEGYSDKIYLKHWISKLAPELEEGIHYTILFFGGSNFKHLLTRENTVDLSFVKSINRNFGIILDSDRTSPEAKLTKNKQDIQQHFEENNLFCWITTYREMENYIDHSDFVNAVKACHKKKEVTIENNQYADWNAPIDETAKKEFKSGIRLPENIFKKIQKNKDGTTTGIPDKDLRDAIDKAVQDTGKITFCTDKTNVAKCYTAGDPAVPQGELTEQLQALINEIKKVNDQESVA